MSQTNQLPAGLPPSPHKRVAHYDGAFKCLDCGSSWGALPGNPVEQLECKASSELSETPETDANSYPPATFANAPAGTRVVNADLAKSLERRALAAESDLAAVTGKLTTERTYSGSLADKLRVARVALESISHDMGATTQIHELATKALAQITP